MERRSLGISIFELRGEFWLGLERVGEVEDTLECSSSEMSSKNSKPTFLLISWRFLV